MTANASYTRFVKMRVSNDRNQDNAGVLYLRGAPQELRRKLKAAAALEGKSMTAYLVQILDEHVIGLERKGALPKAKMVGGKS